MATLARFIFGSSLALTAAALLSGCPDPQTNFEEFQQAWCTPRNIMETFSYCSCSVDSDCGDPQSGWVCNGDGSCQTGCRGADGNSCPEGVDCDSMDSSIGKCAIGCSTAPAAVGEPDGLYFFSLTAGVSPNKPAPLLITLTTDSGGPTGLQFTMEVQPVDADDRMTIVGDPFTVGPFAINGDGSFEADWGEVSVPGETNPLTPSVLTAEIVTIGALCSGEPDSCGIITGQVLAPVMLDLAGSTFYMEKIDDLADHTEPPFLNCAGDTANPL